MTWTGMNKDTGRQMTELDHIRQSVADILTTPVGTRIMRRDYGSQIFELLDQPQNGATRLKLMAATVMALLRWEPRLIIERVQVDDAGLNGRLTISLDARREDTNAITSLSVTVAGGEN